MQTRYVNKNLCSNKRKFLNRKKSNVNLIYIANLFQLWHLHLGQTISELFNVFVISIIISKLVLHVSQWYSVIIDFTFIIYEYIYYNITIYLDAVYKFIFDFYQKKRIYEKTR
jgi:hypothetical protein